MLARELLKYFRCAGLRSSPFFNLKLNAYPNSDVSELAAASGFQKRVRLGKIILGFNYVCIRPSAKNKILLFHALQNPANNLRR